jgi:hypothetical protein
MCIIDLLEILPDTTSRGDEIIRDINDNYIDITYLRKRGKPISYTINRYINREIFLLGIAIWACEGTRRRPHELELSNSSKNVAQLYVSLLRELGIDKYARIRVQALEKDVKKCERFWIKSLGIKNVEKPIIHIRKIRENSNGIVNIRINSSVLRELFFYWASILPDLLQ